MQVEFDNKCSTAEPARLISLWMDQDQEDLYLCKLSSESNGEGAVHGQGCDFSTTQHAAHASVIQKLSKAPSKIWFLLILKLS
jgi:hypothetical protein